jgi:hypothetical protein
MLEMTQVLKRLPGRRGYIRSRARRRIDLTKDGKPSPMPATKVRQWDELIPGSEVSRLRYLAELDGGVAFSRVLLP